ncbi:hypothetical protein E2C01_081747 [Portunus trituberculatus]|uniref:Uncharacterized protein n=1 Tax=Portunus trituberculatus TaxID=210409 RepID=A0A5B7J1Y5_PORTR|nr:hypothetical protein [Portunus trituberculatus]
MKGLAPSWREGRTGKTFYNPPITTRFRAREAVVVLHSLTQHRSPNTASTHNPKTPSNIAVCHSPVGMKMCPAVR